MAQKTHAIGIDIGGTHISCAVADIKTGTLLESTHARATFDHKAPSGEILQHWTDALNQTLANSDAGQLIGFGFAIPGPFDYQNGISRMQHKFEGLYGVHIPDALRPGLATGRTLPMRFINDATAFAIGESWMGEGRGLRKVVVITLGTGFGSAFLDDDVPVVQGAEVPPEGCLWHLPFRDGIADDYFSTRWFTRMYAEQSGHRVPGVKTLMDKATVDPVAGQLFETFGQNLAECLGPWLLRFGAEVLIIGGNIAHALPLFGPALRKGLQASWVSTRITPSVLWEKAALLGSARLLDDAFWAKVSVHLPTL